MLDLVERRATSNGHQNVHTVLSTGQRVPLADGIADFALCVLVLHYPEDLAGRVGIVREIARLVRPGGAVLIINWTPQAGDDTGSRLPSEEMAAILRGAGFKPDGPHPRGESQYTITARRLPPQSSPK
jgi:SAM-dependent methyltransferase